MHHDGFKEINKCGLVYNAFNEDVLLTVYRTRNNKLAHITVRILNFTFDFTMGNACSII